MISVNPRARRNRDRAGDPLDGLVNLFDVGIVLAVAFLLAALSSLHLTDAFTAKGLHPSSGSTSITIKPGETTGTVPDSDDQVIGTGTKVGSVYRLSDGRLVYVTGKSDAATPGAVTPGTTPAPTPSPIP